MSRVNGLNPGEARQQQILRELQSPQLQSILRAERPKPRNRAEARALGAKSAAEEAAEMEQRVKRIEAFRVKTCDAWYVEQLERLLKPWLYRAVLKRPRLMAFLFIRLSAEQTVAMAKGRTYPGTVVRVKWFWKVVAIKQFAWEA